MPKYSQLQTEIRRTVFRIDKNMFDQRLSVEQMEQMAAMIEAGLSRMISFKYQEVPSDECTGSEGAGAEIVIAL